jgi:hypothetical protein
MNLKGAFIQYEQEKIRSVELCIFENVIAACYNRQSKDYRDEK